MAAALAPKIGDLVHQTSSTTGTSDFTLASVNGHRDFSTEFGTGATTDVFYYFIQNRDAAEWERGKGHLSAANTLVRDTVITSSNANAAVNFSAGTKDVISDVPADRCAVFDEVSLASAGTTDLGTYPSICVTITGTTTITSFGSTAKQGTLRFIKFSGALTLTHNATSLIIPGGANITTAAGDCATVRHEGSGNWRVLSYTKADGTAVAAGASATQAEMEAATSTTARVTPGRQHYHPGHLKALAIFHATQTALSGNISSVDTGTERITWSAAHGLSTGDFIYSTGGTWPTGWGSSNGYFVNAISSTVFKAYPTYDDAIADTNAINLTAAGSGTRTASKFAITVDYSFGMAVSNPILPIAASTIYKLKFTWANAVASVATSFAEMQGMIAAGGTPLLSAAGGNPDTTTTFSVTSTTNGVNLVNYGSADAVLPMIFRLWGDMP